MTDSTNPKDAIGRQKPGFDCIPPVALLHQGLAHANGGAKYGPMSWRETNVRASVYYNAMLRHLFAWWDVEDFAADSGIHHLGHMIASANILLDATAHRALVDDRPEPGTFAATVEAMTESRTPSVLTARASSADLRRAFAQAAESASGLTDEELEEMAPDFFTPPPHDEVEREIGEVAARILSCQDTDEAAGILRAYMLGELEFWTDEETEPEEHADTRDPRTFVDPTIDHEQLSVKVEKLISSAPHRNLALYNTWRAADDLGFHVSAYDQVQRTTLSLLIDNYMLSLGLSAREVRALVSEVVGGEQ